MSKNSKFKVKIKAYDQSIKHDVEHTHSVEAGDENEAKLLAYNKHKDMFPNHRNTLASVLKEETDMNEQVDIHKGTPVYDKKGRNGVEYQIRSHPTGEHSIHYRDPNSKNNKENWVHVDTYQSLHRAKSVIANEVAESVELTEEELNELSAASMGHAAEREYAGTRAETLHPTMSKKTKYLVKHKATGKIIGIHNSASDAVSHRNKVGSHETHSIIKEETDMNEQVLELINAIDSGKSEDLESAFSAVMSEKLVSALEAKRAEVASSLFDSVEEEVEPIEEVARMRKIKNTYEIAALRLSKDGQAYWAKEREKEAAKAAAKEARKKKTSGKEMTAR